MKKLIIAIAAVAMVFTSCSNDDKQALQEQNINMDDWYVYTDADVDETNKVGNEKSKSCYSMVVLNRQLNENPGLEQKMYNIEYNTRALIAAKKPDGVGNGNGGGNDGGDGGSGGDVLGVINIPVYVHVVYSNTNENISNTQINSQIAVLNDDFRRTNSDANQTPSEFAGDAADTEIEFTLAGTFRYSDSRTTWGTNNAVKSTYPPVTPQTHLNIWVANIGGGILGYAQFPGGNYSTDGVVISPQYFGTTGYVSSPFDEGRTATHEVGHYLNLRHIWGDGRCNRDDFVSDTPKSDRPNYNCPTSAYHCRSNDQFMNYMDYTDDSCMNMFSTGQKERMRAIFASGGPRASMLQ